MGARKFLTVCSAVIVLLMTAPTFGDLKHELAFDRDYLYQDLFVNGQMIWKGCGPDCPSRYDALRPFLNQFKRPFTVLDIGANNGYFSLRIAENYDALCVMIDCTDRLKKICEYNTNINNIIYLKKYLASHEIEWLAQHEHFDVILCFHVLHHVDDWRRFVSALFCLGDHVIIETPPVNDGFVSLKPTIPEIARYLLSLPSGKQIGTFVRQSPEIRDHMILFSFPNHSKDIRRDFENAGQYSLDTGIWSSLPLGISMKTFSYFNGIFPLITNSSGFYYTERD